jgi:hypothetical protein
MLNRYPLDRNLKVFSRSRRKADAKASANDALEMPSMQSIEQSIEQSVDKLNTWRLSVRRCDLSAQVGAFASAAEPTGEPTGEPTEEPTEELTDPSRPDLNASGSSISGSDVPDSDQAHPPQPNPDESVHMLMRNDISDGSGASGSVADTPMNRFQPSSHVIATPGRCSSAMLNSSVFVK